MARSRARGPSLTLVRRSVSERLSERSVPACMARLPALAFQWTAGEAQIWLGIICMSRKTRIGVAIALVISACTCGGRAPDRLLIPGQRIGPVTADTPEIELKEQLGAEVETGRAISIGEGFCVAGTLLFPGSPDAVEVAWSDSTRSRPAFARIRSPGARWTTPGGVHIGTTLKELEEINGEPVAFSGFGWDYGGTAAWTESAEEADGGNLLLELAPDSASESSVRDHPRYSEIVGERTITSDHPLIQEMTIRVRGMSLGWREPGPQVECPAL